MKKEDILKEAIGLSKTVSRGDLQGWLEAMCAENPALDSEEILDAVDKAMAESPALKTVTIGAFERDGYKLRSLNIPLFVFEDGIDVLEACRNAVEEFTATDEGFKAWLDNEENFNWGDVVDCLPNEICVRHGFRLLSSKWADYEVDYDEQLIPNGPLFTVTGIEWDTDGETVDHLPYTEKVFFEDLLYDGETYDDVDVDELKERVIDFLTEKYGFCIKACDSIS